MPKTKRGELKDLDALTEDPDNLPLHTDQNIGMITDSIKAVGFGRSIVLDDEDIVRAGNGTLKAARRAGPKKVRIIDVEGDEVIAVRRKNLTAEQKKLLAMFDNRAGELAGWRVDLLKQLPEHERRRFFSDKDFKALLKANVVNEDVTVGDGDAKTQNEPTIDADHTIEILCSSEALEKFRQTLDEWAALPDVTINIA